MSKAKELTRDNERLNDINFRARSRIKKFKSKLPYIESLKTIWSIKDRIKELEHKILINEQQVRFNLIVLATGIKD